MESRATNAEKELVLLKEHVEDLKKHLNEVCKFPLFLDIWWTSWYF